jgi:hypothetical protein
MAEMLAKRYVDRKLITVDYTGPILPLGGIYGPTQPKVMPISEIALLIQKHYRVVEHLENGGTVRLDMANYNLDLNGDGGEYLESIKKPVADPIPVPTTEPVKAPDKGTATEEKKTETTVVATPAVKEDDSNSNGKQNVTVSTSGSKADKLSRK